MKKPLTCKFSWKDSELKMSSLLIILVLLPIVSGCGLAFVNAPPTDWETSSDLETIALTQPCTNSKILVAVDGILAAAYAAQGVVYTTQDIWWEPNKNEMAIASFALSAVDIAGAVVGNRKVNECRQFMASLAEQRRGNERLSTTSVDQDYSTTSTPWIESMGNSPLPKIPHRK